MANQWCDQRSACTGANEPVDSKMSEVSTSTRSKVSCRDAAAIIRNIRAYYCRELERNAAKDATVSWLAGNKAGEL